MVTTHPITEEAYTKLVFANPDRMLELYDGAVREKPGMSLEHGRIVSRLASQLQAQLDATVYEAHINKVRVRKPVDTVVIPDLLVVPTGFRDFAAGQSVLPIRTKPLPLVVDVWAPLSSGYDVDAKIPIYQLRGDLEIWRIHPHDRTLTSWVWQSDGTYRETVYQSGLALPVMLSTAPVERGVRFDA